LQVYTIPILLAANETITAYAVDAADNISSIETFTAPIVDLNEDRIIDITDVVLAITGRIDVNGDHVFDNADTLLLLKAISIK